jgi:hypothetical protein
MCQWHIDCSFDSSAAPLRADAYGWRAIVFLREAAGAVPVPVRGGGTMCDRLGSMIMPDFAALAPAMKASRRGMLKATGAAVLTMAAFGGDAMAQGRSSLKSTHGTGFCNLNLFLAHSLQLAR